jgi:hypothetical protein
MTSNPIKLLRDLLPQPPLQVGTVVAISGGVARIQMLGGGTANARGVAAINDRVFFRNDVIEGPAPDLPVEVIEV